MLRTIITIATCSLIISLGNAQTKIGSNVLNIDRASILELESDSSGFLPSRLTTVQRNAQTEWNEGHIIYNTTDNCLQIFDGSMWECFFQGVFIDSTIYKYNDTLTSNRTVGMGGYQLTFDGSGDVVITDAGFVGIGDPTPDAKLDVEDGTVRFSDYGKGDIPGPESYLLGVDSDGDVVEVTPAIDTFFVQDDQIKLSLNGDRTPFIGIDIDDLRDTLNIYTDDGTLLGNRTISAAGNWLRILGDDSGANIQLQNDGDLRQFGPSPIYQLIDTSGTEIRMISNASNGTLGTIGDQHFILRQDGSSTLGLLNDDYLRFYNYGSGARTGTLSNILGVESNGDVIEVDPTTLGSDDQILDSLGLTGTTLEIGIEGDVNGLQSLDLSSLTHTGTTGSIFFADGSDGSPTEDNANLFWDDTNNRLGVGTDAPSANMHLSGGAGSVELLLEADTDNSGESDQPQITFSQDGGGTIGHIGFTGGTNNLRISNESTNANSEINFQTSGSSRVTIEASGDVGIGTTDPAALLDVDGGTVRFSNYGAGVVGLNSQTYLLGVDADGDVVDVDPSSIGTDDQIIDSLGLVGNELQIGLEGDVNGLQTIDLSSILGSSENIYNTSDTLEGDRVITMDGNNLTFDGSDQDFIIHPDGDLSLGTTTESGDFNALSTEDQNAYTFTQGDGTTGEKDVFTIIDEDTGGGGQDNSSVLKVQKSGSINAGDDGFSLVELTYTNGVDPGADKYWISGRRADEGAPSWGVDVTDHDYWSEGGIVLGVTGAAGGTYSGGNFIVEPDGDVGVGTTTPSARLEVSGGSVIFDEYGGTTHKDSLAENIVGVDASGNIIELNTLQNTRWIYAPAVTIDASSQVINATIDLHQEYVDQFTSIPAAQRSSGAPASLPTYDEDELHYYITFFDNTVIDNISISAAGVLEYDIISVPFDNYTIVNVIFMVK